VAALVLVLTGCAAPAANGDAAAPESATEDRGARDAPWAAAAEARFRAEAEAARQGVADHTAYAARDVQRDDLGWRREGRAAWQEDLRSAYGSTYEELAYARTAVDRTGAAVELSVSHLHGFEGAVELLEVRTYARDGVAAVTSSIPLGTARALPTAVGRAAFDQLETVVSTYVVVWGGAADPTDATTGAGALAELYAADARLVDDLQGLELVGRDAIAAYLAASPVAALGLDALPRGDGPASYLEHRVAAAARHLTLVTVGADERSCPGRVVAELELDADRRIVAERRFHAIDDARRCLRDLPGGWWDRLDPPVRDEDVVSVLPLGDVEVTVRGASLGQVRLLRWGFARFAAAGLPPPQVASVTFAEATGRCAGVAGRVTTHAVGSADILLCLDDRSVCRDETCTTFRLGAQQALLHELAHVWEHTWLDDRQRDGYREVTRSPSWLGADDAWADRAGERAAEVLMWGLLESPTRLGRVGDPPCEQLSAEFRQLTGTEPICGVCVS
jgi:hypothetical protein